MINAEQIRVARAILDWSTADLANRTGLTVNGLNKIERGNVRPQEATLQIIQKSFEKAGLEFLPFSGVQKKERIVAVWEGPGSCKKLLGEIYQELRDTGGEVLISGANEAFFVRNVGEKQAKDYILQLISANIRERLLIKEGDTFFIGPKSFYHWLPEQYFSIDPFLIFGRKAALVLWEQPEMVIVLEDTNMVESLTNLFEFIWKNTTGPADDEQAAR